MTVYWLTGTAGSSARLYKETANDLGRANEPSPVPTGVAVFPGEPFPPIQRLAEREHNIMHWSEFGKGGHFPAMEVPDLLVGDLRGFFRRFRPEAITDPQPLIRLHPEQRSVSRGGAFTAGDER